MIQAIVREIVNQGRNARDSLPEEIDPAVANSIRILSRKYPIAQLQWQLFLVHGLLYTMVKDPLKKVLVQLGTGHGKSIIIQLLALSLKEKLKKGVVVVCLNKYLAYQSATRYSETG